MTTAGFSFNVDGLTKNIAIDQCYCIGYSGRDQSKAKEHIQELAELGVPEPDEIPALFPIRTSAISFQNDLEAVGNQTSGEAEIVLVFDEEGEGFLSVGSDHTDRGLETVSIQKSKQVCDKPLSQKLWKLEDIQEHWDQLKLVSYSFKNGERTLYQSNSIEAILHLDDLMDYLQKQGIKKKNSVIYCGTVPLLSGFLYGDAFEVELHDPVRDRKIDKYYTVTEL